MSARRYQEVRKTYVMARIEEPDMSCRQYTGNWRRGRKDDAMKEFDQFVQHERAIAVLEDRRLREVR